MPLLSFWYIIPRLISCVSVTLCRATLSNLAYHLTGRQSFLPFEGCLGFRVKKTLSDLTTKGKGPCSAALQTDKSSEKQHLGNTHQQEERKKIRINLVVKTRGGMEQWQSGSSGNFLSASIPLMWWWLFCRDQSNLWADGFVLLQQTGGCKSFFLFRRR